jgi:hypothetical protein
MPFVPELFSAPALARLQDGRQRELAAVPFFDGLMAGEPDALVESFAVTPQLHDPIRGRVMGTGAFRAFAAKMSSWMVQHNCSVEDVGHAISERRGFEEVVLHFDGRGGRVDLPFALVADRRSDGKIEELRIYFSNWLLTGHHVHRPPLLQADRERHQSDVVGEHQRALSAGDVDAIVATFEPDGYAREPAGGVCVQRGDGLRSFYESLFSHGGGMPLEYCAAIDDGRSCALEYNIVRCGETELPPEAGLAVYVRGESGKLAAVRIYDDSDPSAFAVSAQPLGHHRCAGSPR